LVYVLSDEQQKVDISVTIHPVRHALLFAGLALLGTHAHAQEYYCWFDEAAGVRRCGDAVPPDQARHDREVRNERGITLREEQGEITPEEQAEIDRQRREEQERIRAAEERVRRDQMLLDAYLTVEAIESLRDRRLELIDSQIHVTEILLKNLHKKLDDLMHDAGRFAPYSDKEDAPPIPENLSIDIDRTESAIALREAALDEIRLTQERIRSDFQRDIDRFRELKGDAATRG